MNYKRLHEMENLLEHGEVIGQRPEMSYVRFHHMHMVFSAIRDSVRNPNSRAEDPEKLISDTREFIRSSDMEYSDNGNGFGFSWAVLQIMGIVDIGPKTIVSGLEKIWDISDRDPKAGHDFLRRLGSYLGFAYMPQSEANIEIEQTYPGVDECYESDRAWVNGGFYEQNY